MMKPSNVQVPEGGAKPKEMSAGHERLEREIPTVYH